MVTPSDATQTTSKISRLIKRLLDNDLQTAASGQGFGSFDVETRTEYTSFHADSKPSAALTFLISNPGIENDPHGMTEYILKKLQSIGPLADNIAFESTSEHANTLRARLEKFIAKGADIPANYLKWGGFDPDKANRWNGVSDHALSGIGTFPKGIEFFIPVPESKQDKSNTVAPFEAVQNNFDSRKDAIKEILAQRVAKYTPGLDDAAKQQLIDKVKALTITIEKNEDGGRFSDNRLKILKFTVSSPEQVEFLKSYDGKSHIDESRVKELTNSNPLSLLSDEQRGKALGRSFLHCGDTSEIFPLIAGREDMKRAIIKSLVRLKTSNPELTKEVDSFLGDDAFKVQDFTKPLAEREDMKQSPQIIKQSSGDAYEPGLLHVSMSFPPEKLKSIMEQIAAIDVGLGQAQAPAQPVADDPASIAAQIIAAGGGTSWADKAQAALEAKNTPAPASGRAAG